MSTLFAVLKSGEPNCKQLTPYFPFLSPKSCNFALFSFDEKRLILFVLWKTLNPTDFVELLRTSMIHKRKSSKVPIFGQPVTVLAGTSQVI